MAGTAVGFDQLFPLSFFFGGELQAETKKIRNE